MRDRIVATCQRLQAMLLAKNDSYGNSAADPLRVFSRVDAEQGLLVRIDDKLSRIARGAEYPGDDTIMDLAGYLVLLLAVRGKPESVEQASAPVSASICPLVAGKSYRDRVGRTHKIKTVGNGWAFSESACWPVESGTVFAARRDDNDLVGEA